MTHHGTPSACKVYIDDNVKHGTVALHPDFFIRTGIDTTHHVVVSSGEKQLKLRTRENDLLKANEVAISPGLSILLNVREGDSVSIMDRPTLGDEIFDEVEPIVDLLEPRAWKSSGTTPSRRSSTSLLPSEGSPRRRDTSRYLPLRKSPDLDARDQARKRTRRSRSGPPTPTEMARFPCSIRRGTRRTEATSSRT